MPTGDQPYPNQANATPSSKKRPHDEGAEHSFAKPVAPTPRKTKKQSPTKGIWPKPARQRRDTIDQGTPFLIIRVIRRKKKQTSFQDDWNEFAYLNSPVKFLGWQKNHVKESPMWPLIAGPSLQH